MPASTTDIDWKSRYIEAVRELDNLGQIEAEKQELLFAQTRRLAVLHKGFSVKADLLLKKLPHSLKASETNTVLKELIAELAEKPPETANTQGHADAAMAEETEYFLEQISENEPLSSLASTALRRLAQTTEQQRLEILRELAQHIGAKLTQSFSSETLASGDNIQDLRNAYDDVLRKLLDRLPLDDCKREQLLNDLKLCDSVADIIRLGEKILHGAALAMQKQTNRVNELSGFLSEIAHRLESMDSFLVSQHGRIQESAHERENLQSSMATDLINLNQGVAEANSIIELRHFVSSRFTELQGNFDDYVNSENLRQQVGQKEIGAQQAQLQQLKQETTELREQLEIAQRQALIDMLTGIGNRRAFDNEINSMIARASRSAEPLSIVAFDLDRFKDINDVFGHPVGDQVLQGFCNQAKSHIRQGDFFGRVGGEEFALLMPRCGIDEALAKANEIREKIAVCRFRHHDTLIPVTTSVGVTQWRPGEGAEALYKRVDAALYMAKNSGRNRCCSA